MCLHLSYNFISIYLVLIMIFYDFHDIRTEKNIEDMEVHGYGETDFNVAVNAFTSRVENKIIFMI